MRVVYVSLDPGVPAFGTKGASVHLQELVRAYRALGHHVELLTARCGGAPPPDLADLTVTELPRPEVRDVAGRERASLEVDEVAQARLAQRSDIDLVHERYSLWGGAGIRAAAARGLPNLLEVNAPLIDEQREHRELHHVELAGRRLVETAELANANTAVSEPVARWLRLRAPRARVRVVANGVDTDRFRPVASRRDRPFTVGFVGTLKPWHGVENLVDAVALLRRDVPDVRLLLVGDGPRRSELETRADDLDVPLTTTGPVPPTRIPSYLHEMDVATAPYPPGDRAAYFSPLKVLEYLAAGIPVVASDTGQLPELLDHGRCGELVPPGDAAALAAALARLAVDPSRRAQLGAAGRAKALREHRWQQVATASLELAHGHRADEPEEAA